ncbi:MAG: PilN domain-containing protein [Deltaproteobacteria bacterium]|nr:PilN domain-containing protein [Deltaproteobacteria bacterium]
MIEINLLPVRAARRKETIRFQISIFILTLFLVFVVIFYLKWNVNQRERHVDAQLKLVKEEILKLNKVVGEIDKLKKRKAKLQQKLSVIKDLEKGRLSAVYILDELSQRIPEKMWIEALDKTGKNLKIVGLALDNETIANFMTLLERSRYFGGVELEVTEQFQRGGLKLKKFSLRCSTSF